MAFCEMCGTQIPEGQTRCESCAAPKQEAPKAAPTVENVTAALNTQIDALKKTDVNWIGLVAQLFNLLMLCLPVLKRMHIWEIADDMAGRFYMVAFAVIFVILASVGGYLLKQNKIVKIAGIVNLVAILIIWFMFYDTIGFTVGFYLWLVGVILQLIAPLGMKLFKQYVK